MRFVTFIQAGGGLRVQRTLMNRLFDMCGAKASARKAAGARLTEGTHYEMQRRGRCLRLLESGVLFLLTPGRGDSCKVEMRLLLSR